MLRESLNSISLAGMSTVSTVSTVRMHALMEAAQAMNLSLHRPHPLMQIHVQQQHLKLCSNTSMQW